MPESHRTPVRDLLLTHRGLVFPPLGDSRLPEQIVRACELELSNIGFVLSDRLRAKLATCSIDGLAAFRAGTIAALLEHIGGDRKHEPLFRRFPEGIPNDTEELWWRKVLVHFLQGEDQPCLFCGRTGTTHVLNPCRHVVCDRCFDGSNYSACPSCEHHVDQSSPFFEPSPDRQRPVEKVVFKLLDLGLSESAEARSMFVGLCERKQALSKVDREAILVILRQYKSQALAWIPAVIPVRENVAIVFGTLFQECKADEVLPVAARYITTATDVLRFIAVLSGTDGSLQRETVFRQIERTEAPSRFWGEIAKLIGAKPPGPYPTTVTIPIRVDRFKVAKLSRSLRRSVLNLLERIERERLIEDMLRHRSFWVWVGEFLHPGEMANRFPKTASAFQVVRKNDDRGIAAPPFQTWYSRVENAIAQHDVHRMLTVLKERPGEFARRFDLAIRVAGDDAAAVNDIVYSLVVLMPALATPVLLTLRNHLSKRHGPAKVRIYWPKGQIAKCVSSSDDRADLPAHAIEPTVVAIETELLRRFSQKPRFDQCVIDEDLKNIPVPFNERTASAAAVSLPRGSQIGVPEGKAIRLFLHWCQPEKNPHRSDLDLSVALYDEKWRYLGVCSYYQLTLTAKDGRLIARSSGDLRDAPWPNGATEFVDLHSPEALELGTRFAVMVINNYAGMPFTQLERGFAGLMFRDDSMGHHFDPRTVHLKFTLTGENGVFLPLVFDLWESRLHWLDVQSKGQFEMNNVENSRSAIAKLCPELIEYFSSGVRPSMFDLALLHGAARCRRVIVRGIETKCFVHRDDENDVEFHERIVHGKPDELRSGALNLGDSPALAALVQGNIDLPVGSSAYALFRERVIPTLAASDLLS